MPAKKPKKPFPSFPLIPHPNGQWCKKIKGTLHYFGPWSDPNSALRRYHAVAAELHAGRQPTVSTDEVTVKETCNSFLNWQRGKLDAGDIGPPWFEDCRSSAEKRMVSDCSTALARRFPNSQAGRRRRFESARPL